IPDTGWSESRWRFFNFVSAALPKFGVGFLREVPPESLIKKNFCNELWSGGRCPKFANLPSTSSDSTANCLKTHSSTDLMLTFFDSRKPYQLCLGFQVSRNFTITCGSVLRADSNSPVV